VPAFIAKPIFGVVARSAKIVYPYRLQRLHCLASSASLASFMRVPPPPFARQAVQLHAPLRFSGEQPPYAASVAAAVLRAVGRFEW
jgi:hypothetical protein